MTRKFNSRRVGNTTIKTLDKQPIKFAHAICPLNLEEQKERFLKHGKLPKFVLKGSEDEIESLFNKERNQIRFELFGEAEYILKTVKEKYGDGDNYLTAQFGEKITKDEATTILEQYLRENNLDGAMSIVWCADLASSARMMWIGPHCKHNKPEARNYSFWIKNSDDNNFLREQGIRCLADHEIGTHFFRSFNDGLQPWYSDRKRFDLRGRNSLEELRAEEGLAAINTILNAKVRFLWGPALLYYTACKAAEMTFKQLYDHLSIYVKSPEHRWRLCMRVKRGLLDPNDLGGYGKDQCYFEGAVEILRSLDEIDFNVMMSGKICVDEVQRCKRLARLDCLKLPVFMKNENRYKKHLKAIAHLNGLDLQHQKKNAPAAYIRRLKQGRRIGTEKVRRIRKKHFKGVKNSSPKGSHSTDTTGSEYEDYCCGSRDSRVGGGKVPIVENIAMENIAVSPSIKDQQVECCTACESQNNVDDNLDCISLKSCDTTSLMSTISLKSDCKSITSYKSKKSFVSNISEFPVESTSDILSYISVSSQRTTSSNLSGKSNITVRLEELDQSRNISPPELTDSLSTNNNARKATSRRDILPPLVSMGESKKSWTISKNGILRLNNPTWQPPHVNHNVCTTFISNHDAKQEMDDNSMSKICRISQNKNCNNHITDVTDTSEIFLPKVNTYRHDFCFSLTDSALIQMKTKSPYENSKSHENFEEDNNIMEQGPEKFIYPDFNYFDSDFVALKSPFLRTKDFTDFSNEGLRRAKSANYSSHLKSQTSYLI